MKRCSACKLDFTGNLDTCPLCNEKLTGDAEPSVFPENKLMESSHTALSVFAGISVACIALMVIAGTLAGTDGGIIVAVCFAVIVNYLFIRNIILHTPDFLRSLVRYFLVLLAIAALWFVLTGDLTVTTFVIPGICLSALIVDVLLIMALGGSFVSGYAKYLLYDIVLGVIPLALSLAGLTSRNGLALASAAASGIFLLVLVLFTRRRLFAELKKLFSA